MYTDQLWYLGETEEQVKQIVPTAGISMQKVSALESIDHFEQLSKLLGADLSATEVVEAKASFTEAEEDLKAAIAEKPDLTVVVVSPATDSVYIASPRWMTDLYYFHDLGLDIIDHDADDFFKQISWERMNSYSADLVLVDQRNPTVLDEISTVATWNALPAVQAGQIGAWFANAPYSYGRLIPVLEDLTATIRASRTDIV